MVNPIVDTVAIINLAVACFGLLCALAMVAEQYEKLEAQYRRLIDELRRDDLQ